MDARFKSLEPALQRWGENDFETADPYAVHVKHVIDDMGETSRAILEMIYRDKLQHSIIANLMHDNVHNLRKELKWIRREIVERAAARQKARSRGVVQLA